MGLVSIFLLASAMMVALTSVSVLVFMPFIGSLIRLRANYNPKAVGLDTAGKDNHVGPRLTSLWTTLVRTWQLEGLYGLYKGWFAAFCLWTSVGLVSLVFVGSTASKGPKGSYHVPEKAGIGMAILPFLLLLISLPLSIILNRAVITPYQLPWNIRESLNVLMSPYERENPKRLYATPGLAPAVALRAVATTIGSYLVRRLLLGSDAAWEDRSSVFPWIVWWIYLAGSAAWLNPLEVVIAKLSVQPNTDAFVSGEDPDSISEQPEGLRFAGTDEDVVGLRPTSDAYTGLADCVRKIIDEEGLDALYRGWWWTSLASLGLLSQ